MCYTKKSICPQKGRQKTEVTGTDRFKLVSSYAPTGDQPDAIEALTRGVLAALVGSLIYRFIYAVVFYTKIVPVECLKLLTAIIVALAIAAPSIQRWAAFQRRKAAAKGKGGN